jgi:hypothetical protein
MVKGKELCIYPFNFCPCNDLQEMVDREKEKGGSLRAALFLKLSATNPD